MSTRRDKMLILTIPIQEKRPFKAGLTALSEIFFSKINGKEENNFHKMQFAETKNSDENSSNDELVNELFLKYRDLIFKKALGILLNNSDAEDITQDVFLCIINKFDKISKIPCEKLPFYLVSITENLAINFLNKKNRHPTEDIDEHYELSDNASVEKSAEAALLLKEVKSALSELSDGDYSLIFLSAFEQMTPQEIAETLDISVKKVYTYTDRARKRLIKILNKRGVYYDF